MHIKALLGLCVALTFIWFIQYVNYDDKLDNIVVKESPCRIASVWVQDGNVKAVVEFPDGQSANVTDKENLKMLVEQPPQAGCNCVLFASGKAKILQP